MKRIAALSITFILLASFAWSLDSAPPLQLSAKDARTMGMGGAFTALGSGYQSLYGNPAGFAVGRGMLTLLNTSVWAFVKPTTQNITEVASLNFTDMASVLPKVSELLTTNGLGLGAAAGLGFTGGGLGLGATVVTEEYARGNTLLGTSFTSATQVNVVAGLAITLGPKEFNFKLGGDLRPFIRVDSAIPVMDLLTVLSGSSSSTGSSGPLGPFSDFPARYGVGLAADLGAIFTMGSLSAGLSIRDIAPPFGFTSTTLANAVTGSVQADPANDPQVNLVPDISVGLGWSPKFIPGIIDPALYLEMKDALTVIQEGASPWNLLHAGAELRLLSFLYLRGGMSQGWLSAGAGINLLILQADVAAFTEELGLHPGDKPRTGLAVNVRLHF